jgi:hypothetical protein
VHVDSATASGYWEVTEDGPCQPTVMLATLGLLGMPVAVDVVPGQRNVEPLYPPIIERVRASVQRTGLLDVGDSTLGGPQTCAPLSLSPVYLSRDDHVTGLVRRMTIAVRALSLLEYRIRQQQAAAPEAEPPRGLYAGQPSRTTRRLTAGRVPEARGNLTLTVVTLPARVIRHLTPRSELQQRLLALAGLGDACYRRLVEHSAEPPG